MSNSFETVEAEVKTGAIKQNQLDPFQTTNIWSLTKFSSTLTRVSMKSGLLLNPEVLDIANLTEDSSPVGGNYLIERKTSDGTIKKVSLTNAAGAGIPLAMNCLEGLAASNNATDPDFDIDFTKGRRRDSTNAVNMLAAAALTKKMDEKFAAGTGAGGADLGMTVDKASLTTNVVTITTKAAHGLTNGSTVLIANLNVEPHMNGKFVIASVPTTSSFTYALTHGNVTEASATQGVVIACSVGAVATRPNAPYYAYVGLNGSTVDIFFSYSAVGATSPTGYTYFRMILGFMVDTDGHILPGTWSEGNQHFRFKTSIVDRAFAAVAAQTRVLMTVSAPAGALGEFTLYGTYGGIYRYAIAGPTTDPDVTVDVNNAIQASYGDIHSTPFSAEVDSNRQVYMRATHADCYILITRAFRLSLGAFDYY